MTRAHASVGDQAFGGADNGGKERNSHQQLSVNGRPIPSLFYNVGVTGVANDAEGEDPNTYFGRLAWDVMPDVMVGVYGTKGSHREAVHSFDTNADGTEEYDVLGDWAFTRTGVDAQAEFMDFRLTGVYYKAQDDVGVNKGISNIVIEEQDNTAAYVEGMYVFKSGGRPWFVPLVRADQYTKNDGKDDYASVTANVTYYYTENVKAYFEYWKETKRPDNKDKGSRATLQISAAF